MKTIEKARGYVGRTSYGDRIWVEMELRERTSVSPHQTVTHEQVSQFLELSISGVGVRKHARTIDQAGQIHEELGRITDSRGGLRRSDMQALQQIWQRWHLNDMRAGCVHQGGVCPEGYQHGSAWLVELLPESVVEQVRSLMDDLDGGWPE